MTLSARILISGQRSSIRCCWLIRIHPMSVFSTSARVPLWLSVPKMGSRPFATIVTCTMHGLRHAPGCCQVEVSLGVLAFVVLILWFLRREWNSREGTEHFRKSSTYFKARAPKNFRKNNFYFICAMIWHRLAFSLQRKKRSENMSTMILFHRNGYLCSKFVSTSCLHELTYSILADFAARLNLVNSTVEVRISHGRFVASKEDTDRFAYFASWPTRAEPRK